jgi:hypothetical protein
MITSREALTGAAFLAKLPAFLRHALRGRTTHIHAFLARQIRPHGTGVYLTVHAAPDGSAEEWSKWCIRGRAEGLFQTLCDDFRHLRSGVACVGRIDRPHPRAIGERIAEPRLWSLPRSRARRRGVVHLR